MLAPLELVTGLASFLSPLLSGAGGGAGMGEVEPLVTEELKREELSHEALRQYTELGNEEQK